MGVPVVATDIRGCRQVVDDGTTGLLVPVGDPVALAAAIERLAMDPAERRRLGTAARRKAQDSFDQGRCIDMTLATYERLLVRAGLAAPGRRRRRDHGHEMSTLVVDVLGTAVRIAAPASVLAQLRESLVDLEPAAGVDRELALVPARRPRPARWRAGRPHGRRHRPRCRDGGLAPQRHRPGIDGPRAAPRGVRRRNVRARCCSSGGRALEVDPDRSLRRRRTRLPVRRGGRDRRPHRLRRPTPAAESSTRLVPASALGASPPAARRPRSRATGRAPTSASCGSTPPGRSRPSRAMRRT